MANPARARTVEEAPHEQDYLGPATVVEVHGARVVVLVPERGDARIDARMALAYPYRPVPDDSVLVIARRDTLYVIGVLEARGDTRLELAGNVELRARGGALRLASDREIELDAPAVSTRASRVTVLAETAVEKVGSLVQHVRTLLSVRANRAETIVEEGTITRAKTATILTDESMTINGKQIHLG